MMIHFDHITYSYPQAPSPALRSVTLHIPEGDFVLVIGVSGSGKSTFLRCINGLVPHFSGGTLAGTLLVDGLQPVYASPLVMSRHVGFVFQDPEAQFVVDQVEDEIAFALENHAFPHQEMRIRVEEVLDLLDLAPLRNRRLDTLSGGEQQRVAIASALALRPRVLVLDEPTSQLDPKSAEDVLTTLQRLNSDLGLTVVIAEHRMERVLPFVDRVVALTEDDDGVLAGSPREVLQDVALTPPLITLGKALGWKPLPLTIKEGRRFAQAESVRAGVGGKRMQNAECRMQNVQHSDISARWFQHSSDMDKGRGSGVRGQGSGVGGRGSGARGQESGVGSRGFGDTHSLLQVHGVTVAYDNRPVLQNINLDAPAGAITALMGRNGSGKTTLLKSIVGLVRLQRGTVQLDGKHIHGQDTAEICRQVGYLPQNPNALLFAETVQEELAMTLRNHGEPANTDTIHTLLAELGLADKAQRYPRDLSTGERQRVALAAIAITHPRVLLLDEPTRGLDGLARQQLIALLRGWRDAGMAILLVTHDVELAALADRVILMSQGSILASGSPHEIMAASPLFAPQIARLFPSSGWLTAEDVLAVRDDG
jgi:energy-coupling factor transport system ATP-binding protein